MKKLRLCTPGPTEVHPETLLAMAAPVIHHRSRPAVELIGRVHTSLQKLFFTKQRVFMISGSGTSAMEAAVVNHFSPGDEVITIEGGKFGERWSSIARAYGLKVHAVGVEWGTALSPEQLYHELEAHPNSKGVFATCVETSTATLTDIKGLAKMVQRTKAILVVDAVSAIGAVPLKMDEWGVDVVATGSQKAMMLPPGLAFIACSVKAIDMWSNATLPRFYFDLGAMDKAWGKSSTPFTPPISLVVGLEDALLKIEEEGLESVWFTTEALGRAARAGVAGLGLEVYSKQPAPGVTAGLLPEGCDGKKLVNEVRDRFNIFIAGGQGKLAARIIRLSSMGYTDRFDLIAALGAIEKVLCEMGFAPPVPGGAITDAMREMEGA
jgi:serine---pyruvate transaminase